MINLDEVAGTQPVDLDALFEQEKQQRRIPELVAKNKAAMTALLTPEPVDTYERLMMELSQGDTTTLEQIKREDDLRNRDKNLQTVLEIMGDPSLPDDIKQSAIMSINQPKDTIERVKEEALIADDDTIDGKPDNEVELRKISAAEVLRPTFEYDQKVQAVLNKNKVFKNEVTAGKVAGFFAFLAPFSTSVASNRALFDIAELLKIDPSRAEATLLSGSFKRDIVDALKALPPERRGEAVEQIVDIVESTGGVYFGSDNDFNQWLLGQEILQGNYSKVDEFFDNATSLLDATIFGGIAARGVKGAVVSARATKSAEEAAASIKMTEEIGTTPVPTAPANVVGGVNNQKGRDYLEVVVESEGDELATVLYGQNKQEAVQGAVMPDPLRPDGTMAGKVPDPARNIRTIVPDPDVVKAVNDDGALYLTAAEKTKASSYIVNNFEKVTGVFPLDNSTQIGVVEGNKVLIRALYATPDGGFLKPEAALDQAKFAFREYGVDDKNLTLMQKQEGEWRPVSPEEVKGTEGEFAVKIDVERPITAKDVEFEEFDVALNLLGQVPYSFSFPRSIGSFSRMLVTPDSMFRPEISRSAARAVDRAINIEKAMLKRFDDFGKGFEKLDKTQKEMLNKHILEANHYGLELSDTDLLARGFNQDSISALKKWRDAWDTQFYFENRDLVQTLRTQGYEKLITKNGDNLVAKRVKQPAYRSTEVYDSTQGKVVAMSGDEVKALYEKGGYLATLRRPTKFEDDVAEVVVVRNTPEEYTRVLNDSDQILNYRKGYFARRYDNPKFVEQNVYDKNGNFSYSKVVATSDNATDAARFLERKAAEEGVDPKAWGKVRDDIKTFDMSSDAYWDVTSAGGRMAQRQRGKLLEDAAGPVDVSAIPYVLDPSEASIRAARSLSYRVSIRNMIETTKERYLQQYAEYFPKNKFGQPVWVEPDKLLVQTTATDKKLADARSAVEYVNYLERGYINSIDKVYKVALNGIADYAAGKGSQFLDKNIRKLAEANPAAFSKNFAFISYLATHPLRQWIVQPSQTARLIGYNPRYMTTGGLVRDSSILSHYKVLEIAVGKEKARKSILDRFGKNAHEMIEYIDDSGLLSSVDKSNLVRGPLTELADSSNKALKFAASPINVTRRIGYDFGEQMNIAIHALTVRDRFIQQGRNLSDPAVRDEALGLTRAISWDMNKAGDFPYNQNWMSPLFQFLQVPHKAMAMYASRSIPFTDKLRFLASDLVLYGIPGGNRLTSLIPEEYLPDDPIARDLVWNGALSASVNILASQLAGEQKLYNLESLRPYGFEGHGAVLAGIMEGGISKLFTEAPMYNLLARESSPLVESYAMAIRYLKGEAYTKLDGSKEGVLDIFKEASTFFKGLDNYYKAQVVIRTGKIVDNEGNLLKDDADFMDTLMNYVGLPPQGIAAYYEASKAIREDTKAYEQDLEKVYKEMKRFMARQEVFADNPERAVLILGMMNDVIDKDPRATELVNRWIVRDMFDNDAKLARQALQYANIPTEATTEEKINRYLATRPEEGEKVWKLFNDMKQSAKTLRESEEEQ